MCGTAGDNLAHGQELIFHITHQFKLCAAAVQILLRTRDMEVHITYKIVGEETNSAFQSHQFGAPGQIIQFCLS